MFGRLLLSSRFVFFVSIAFGLLFSGLAALLEPLIVPALIVMMTISLAQVASRHVHKHHERRTVLGLVLVNLAAGLVYVLLAWLVIPEPHKPAIYLLGLVPPAVGIIPLTRLLHGDLEIGFIAEFAGYLLSLIVIPIGTFLLFDQAADPWRVLRILGLVIVLPFLLSRLIRRTSLHEVFARESVSKTVINLCYGVTFAAVVGVNASALLDTSLIIVAVVLVCVKLFGSWIAWLATVHNPDRISVLYALFSTFKNGGAAIAIIVLLFGAEATAALAVNAIIVPFHIMFVERLALHS